MELPILEQIMDTASFNVPTEIGDYVSTIVGAMLLVAGIAAFLFLVWGGLNWVMAGGDKGKVEEARTRITNALIGLAIVAASWAIFLLVDFFLGLNIAGGARGGGRFSSESRMDNNPRPNIVICDSSSAEQCKGVGEGSNCGGASGRTCQARGNTTQCSCR